MAEHEHTPKFEPGTWVKGTTTDGEAIACGYVSRFDTEDGQHYVRGVVQDLAQTLDPAEGWAEPDELRETAPPEWIAPSGPGHAFVCDWMDDHVANVALHAEPEDVANTYCSDADADERKKVELKLMEAVADPGERVELVPGGVGVRFCVVNP